MTTSNRPAGAAPEGPELGTLNHIGIAVPDEGHDGVVDTLTGLFAGVMVDGGQDDGLDARWTWVRASSGLILEVVSPRSPADGPVNRFLTRTGGGLHHVSFDASDIGACRTAAFARGARIIGESDDHGGWAEFFVDPAQTGRALFHWMQAVR